jgi:hypothetical protein
LKQAINPSNAGGYYSGIGMMKPEPQIPQAESEAVTVDEDVSRFVFPCWSSLPLYILHFSILLWSEGDN